MLTSLETKFGLFECDSKLVVTFVNDHVCDLFGLPRGSIIGHSIIELVHAGDREAVEELLQAILAGNYGSEPIPFSNRNMTSIGTCRFHWSNEPIIRSGEVVGIRMRVWPGNQAHQRLPHVHTPLTAQTNFSEFSPEVQHIIQEIDIWLRDPSLSWWKRTLIHEVAKLSWSDFLVILCQIGRKRIRRRRNELRQAQGLDLN